MTGAIALSLEQLMGAPRVPVPVAGAKVTASFWIPHVAIPHLGGCLTALLLELPK